VRTAVIQALEHYLPKREISNDELAQLYAGWSAERILEKTGIRERRIVGEGETASDLAFAAAQRLLARVNIEPQRVDLLILCTQSPDYFLPTTACILQDRLGLPTSTAAFDFNLGCSVYPYGLAIVKGLIETGTAQAALLVTAETYSRYMHPLDKSVRTLFGDAASATLITAEERERVLLGPFVLGTDGSGAQNLIVPRGAHRLPPQAASLAETKDNSGNVRTDANLFMDGPAIFEFTMRQVPQVLGELLRRAKLQPADIDHFVFHQANEYMLRYLQRKIGIPDQKFPVCLEHCGNTVSSTIPIVIQQLADDSRLHSGDLIAVVGFGVGYSWGAGLVRWEPGLAA